MKSVVEQMIRALDLEVAAIKKRGGSNTIGLRGGQFRGRSGPLYVYAFPLTEDVHLRDDSPVRVIVEGKEINGTIASCSDEVLVVALEEDLGAAIPYATLVTDESFLVERLKEKFEAVLAGEASFVHDKADQAIGLRPHDSSAVTVPDGLLKGDAPPNEGQVQAISRALASELLYMWGPPGTGKTVTLARIVEGLYGAGMSVLLVSNTNVAVDTALEKVAERLRFDEGFHRGAVLRYPRVVTGSDLDRYYGDKVDLDRVVDRLGGPLRSEKEKLERSVQMLKGEATPWQTALQRWRELEEAEKREGSLRAALRSLKRDGLAIKAELPSLKASLDELRAQLRRAQEAGFLRRLFTGLDPDAIRIRLVRVQTLLSSKSEALTAIVHQFKSLRPKLGRASDDTSRLKQLPSTYPSLKECESQLQRLRDEMKSIENEITEIDAQLEALRDEVLQNCRVLACTAYRTYLKGQVERTFDAVVIDEASMLTGALAYYAAGRATRSVVVAGDFRQLPPIVISNDPDAQAWLKKDVFHLAHIPQAVDQDEPGCNLVPLNVQYRMHQDICSLVNDAFYSNPKHRLKTSSLVLNREPVSFPLGERRSRLLYVDTSPFHPWAAYPLGKWSRYNVFHALLIRNVLSHFESKKQIPREGGVAVIAPFRAQTELLGKMLSERLSPNSNVVAKTVHTFQGKEKDAIILDLTESFGCRLSRFARAQSLEEDGARLLNVALSRAKEFMLLIANFEFFHKRRGLGPSYMRVLEHFVAHGESMEPEAVLRLGPDEWLEALSRVKPAPVPVDDKTLAIFNEGTFYPAFKQDIEHAEKCVVIVSPFATEAGTGRWMDLLRTRLSDKVNVRIVTRPPRKQHDLFENQTEELIQQMRIGGVAVDLRQRLHEKCAIIDGRILWHGSLNILSHSKTSESMLRIPSRAACAEMAQFLGLSDLGRPHDVVCPKCGGDLVLREGPRGPFFGCINYPSCGFTKRFSRGG